LPQAKPWQGGTLFRRAGEITRGPARLAVEGRKPGYEEMGAELRAKLGR